ncbi:PaaI family thioesterase [Paracoccus sp. (in: a-proteobacteria)]|uniref:PaaI family thioesterase n=1 Tax=Paracoccus sp. TaxID=267 RepID=UPI00396CB132
MPDRSTETMQDMVRRVTDSFNAQGLMRHLGARIAAISHGEVRIHLPFRPELTQQLGYFHAGSSAAVADAAGGYAAFTLFPPDTTVLTTEFKLNLLNPAAGDALEAIGRVIKPGRTLTICQLDVWALQGDERRHVAIGLQTLIRVADRVTS